MLIECPAGIVQEDTFKEIYAKFFPYGNSSVYAHLVFRAFDVTSCGAITFKWKKYPYMRHNNNRERKGKRGIHPISHT
ncbi:Kv channel-interacting protein 1 [Orchesella cincta]|uniref:Kv channel-interacting protein 1 n=1 Tax=Orchesella cincta TaxID=48709 RepID=A0A1D2N3T9_ORCCI|nr:Kv channel-interacting protein 1 [Orchesella cincta]